MGDPGNGRNPEEMPEPAWVVREDYLEDGTFKLRPERLSRSWLHEFPVV